MAALVLDTLWSECSIEQSQVWDSPFYGGAEIKLKLVSHEVCSKPHGNSILSSVWSVLDNRKTYIFLNIVISNFKTALGSLRLPWSDWQATGGWLGGFMVRSNWASSRMPSVPVDSGCASPSLSCVALRRTQILHLAPSVPRPSSRLRCIYKLSLSFKIKTVWTLFLVHTGSKSLFPLCT